MRPRENGFAHDENGDEQQAENVRGSGRARKAVLRLGSTDPNAPVQWLPGQGANKKTGANKKESASEAAKRGLKAKKQQFEAALQAHKQAVAANSADVPNTLSALESAWLAIAGDIDRL